MAGLPRRIIKVSAPGSPLPLPAEGRAERVEVVVGEKSGRVGSFFAGRGRGAASGGRW